MARVSKLIGCRGELLSFTEPLPSVRSLPLGPLAEGMDAIYALQEVDPHSIRPLKSPKPHDPQLYMPFAEKGHGTMPTIRLAEPIQVLNMTRQSERALLRMGKTRVGEAHALLLDSETLPEGMSQFEMDELRERVVAYLADFEDPFAVKEVDFLSLIRTIVGDLDRLSVYLFLSDHELEDALALRPAERERIRRIGPHEAARRKGQVGRQLLRIERQRPLWAALHRIVGEFIEPWLAKRGGIAAGRAVRERLCSIAVDRQDAKHVIALLGKLYAPAKGLWALLLREAEEGVYCVNEEVALEYECVILTAREFFYHPSVAYPLPDMVGLVSREIARSWEGFKQGFVERVLKSSPTFRVRKGRMGLRYIRLSD